jgi:hypothetical protein
MTECNAVNYVVLISDLLACSNHVVYFFLTNEFVALIRLSIVLYILIYPWGLTLY